MATYLDTILAAHRRVDAADGRDRDELAARAAALPPGRGFTAALRSGAGLSVIAEIKRASPSRGPLAPGLDPAELARAYQAGGAAGLSVLTDRDFFAGSPEDLVAARAAVGVPVLRKDFTVGTADVCDARLMGADAVLLIAAALSPRLLGELLDLARTVGIDALVEVHDEAEAEVALAAGASLVGVNQRDLVTFAVDTARAERVVKVLPDTVVRVAESGIRHADDAARLAAAGFDAVLVGESLVTAADPAAAVAGLVAARLRSIPVRSIPVRSAPVRSGRR
jgi:indole-3-glycerol phosphate synthase